MVKDIKIIVGANYGDEGKGRMTDYFAREHITEGKDVLVICTNGGAQRGHTVVLDNGYRHIFHHFGSGTLTGADTYLPESFIINPMIFMKEYNELESFAPTIFVHPNCLVSTPFDMLNNQIIEESRGINKHGSCGVGIWETIVRDGKRYKEMINMSDDQLFGYLKYVRDKYSIKRFLKKNIMMTSEWEKIYYNDELIHHYIRDFRAMSNSTFGITTLAEDDIIEKYDTIIFENGQGLLLDGESNKDDIYSTPSDTKLGIPLKMIKAMKKDQNTDVEVIFVTRSYLTRHCLGDFREQKDLKELNFIMPNYESNTNNIHQGEFRYGLLSSINDIYNRAYLIFNAFRADLVHNSYTNEFIGNYRFLSQSQLELGTVKMSIAITHLDEHEIDSDISSVFYHKLYKSYGPKCTDKVEAIQNIKSVKDIKI